MLARSNPREHRYKNRDVSRISGMAEWAEVNLEQS